MLKYAVIVAGGSGSRMGGGLPKQFRSLCGKPVVWWSLKAFHDEDPRTGLILVLPQDFIPLWKDYLSSLPAEERIPHEIASGGTTRGESVQKGLKKIPEENSLVAVHDGARPLVSASMISEGWKSVEETGAAIPVIPVSDSLRRLSAEGSEAVDRKDFVAVQTPQVFHTEILKKGYQAADGRDFTDDASVVENAGCKISLFKGSVYNMKVTNPMDLEIAAVLMKRNA